MNTHRIHQIRTATFTTVVAFIACASIASPASAGETHDNGEGGSGRNSVSPFAVPIAALDGLISGSVRPEPSCRQPTTRHPGVASVPGSRHGPRHQSGVVLFPTLLNCGSSGGAGGARTHDPRIMSPLL